MNKYLINLGFINITWYAFFIVLSILLGSTLLFKNKKLKQFLTYKDIEDYLFYLIIFSIIGARTWYVLFSYDYYISNPLDIVAIWKGGLAIHGGLVGGLLYNIYYAQKKQLNIFLLTDALILPLLLGQTLGRWGNFINQEAYGPATTFGFLKNTLHLPDFIVNQMNISGVYYHPTFLYESIWNLFGFFIVLLILNPLFKNKYGYITSFYLIWYGFIRTFIEQLRQDALMFGNIKIAQFTSICMFFTGILIIIFLIYKDRKELKVKKGGL